MRTLLIAGLIALSPFAALAQTTAAPPPEPEYAVKLKQHELAYIAGVLQKRPYEESAGILNSIQEQINAAAAPKVEVKTPPSALPTPAPAPAPAPAAGIPAPAAEGK